jgi:hypothetical protein
VYYKNFFNRRSNPEKKQIKKWSRLKKEKLINSINLNLGEYVEIEKF